MKKYITPGTVAGALACASVVASAFGKTELADFLGSSEAAAAVISVANGLLILAAGVLPGIKKTA